MNHLDGPTPQNRYGFGRYLVILLLLAIVTRVGLWILYEPASFGDTL
jgi:hypothetical protein